MIYDVEKRLAAVHNELKAQKVYSGITYSQLLLPENNPVESYSGSISLSGGGTGPLARLRFRFTRLDGSLDTPLVDFASRVSISPTYKEFAEANSFVFSKGDLSYTTILGVNTYIGELGDGYTDFYVDFEQDLAFYYFSLSNLSVSVQVQAMANIKGTLIVTRTI